MELRDESDARLVNMAQCGDQEACGELYRRYRDRVYGICRSRLGADRAEDATHDTFERVFRRLPHFEGGQLIEHYIMKTAKFACMDRQTARVARHELPLAEVTEHDFADPTSAHHDHVLEHMNVREILGSVTEAEASLLVSHHIEERPLKEIADLQQSTPGSIAVRLHRARKAARLVASNRGIWSFLPIGFARVADWWSHRRPSQPALHTGLAFAMAGLISLPTLPSPEATDVPASALQHASKRSATLASTTVTPGSASASHRQELPSWLTGSSDLSLPETRSPGPGDAPMTLPLPPVQVPATDREIRQEYPDQPDYEVRLEATDVEVVSVAVDDEQDLEPAMRNACPLVDSGAPQVSCEGP